MMNLDDAKENIQPLAAGRNISILQASLRHESPQEMIEQRRELERAIHNYSGDDPLCPWYAYISWIEQSCPSGGKESGLMEVVTKCISCFESEKRYYQDRRMIKLYIKFIDSHKDPIECYQQLFNAGIGTMVADFYIAWAYCYDLCGNYRRAEEIFCHGIACRAEPFDELKEAHLHFGYSIAQRFVCGNDEAKADANRQLEERRIALTSLRGQRRKAQVGSIRTGDVIKSYNPGIVKADSASTSQKLNENVAIYKDENINPNVVKTAVTEDYAGAINVEDNSASVVRSIIDTARQQENLKEPGPWNKAHDKKHASKLFPKTANKNGPSFEIHVDDNTLRSRISTNNCICKPLDPPIIEGPRNFDKPFKYPENFQRKNRKQPYWNTPVTIEHRPDYQTIPNYNKCMLYPRPNEEFQLEEYTAYRYFKRRNEENQFTKSRDEFWSCHDINANVRMYPNFAKQSLPQTLEEIDKFEKPEQIPGLMIPFNKIYNTQESQEFQVEEIYAQTVLARLNQTIIASTDMEETVCLSEKVQRRKSFFPNTKTIVPNNDETENDFEFKLPATPLAVPSAPIIKKPTKINFEIYVENSSPPANVVPPSSGAGFFDGEETCSTQTFNIFLKSQSVSTPKAAQKQTTQRQFGTIVKEPAILPPSITPPTTEPQPSITEEHKSELKEVVDQENQDVPSINAASLIYSPQIRKQLSTILETSEHGTTQGTTGSHGSTKFAIYSPESEEDQAKPRLYTQLETLQEATNESLALSSTSKTEDITEKLKKTHLTSSTKLAQQLPQTPGDVRLLDPNGPTNISLLNEVKQVGNFTRLEEREDTANAFGAMRVIRFPEDKTETITKSMITSKQDDKTETISNFYFPKANSNTKFEDDKTETIPKIMVQPPQFRKPTDNDDSFDIFMKTPPKVQKSLSILSIQQSPLPFTNNIANRFCDIDTPDVNSKFQTTTQKTQQKHNILIFEDDSKDTQANSVQKPFKNTLLRDSFVPDFSLLEEVKSVAETNRINITSSTEVKESQTPLPAPQFEKSYLPDLSFELNTHSQNKVSNSNSFLKNISIVPDSQPQHYSIPTKWKHQEQQHIATVKTSDNKFLLPDTSIIPESQTPASSKWKQNPNNSETKESSHLLLSYMNDLASIKQTNNLEKSNPNSTNSLLKFLNTPNQQNNEIKQNNSMSFFEQPSKSSIKPVDTPQSVNVLPKSATTEQFFELNAETAMFDKNLSMIKNSTWLPVGGGVTVQQNLSELQEKSFHIKSEQFSILKDTSFQAVNVPTNNSEPLGLNDLKQKTIKTETSSQCSNVGSTSNNSKSNTAGTLHLPAPLSPKYPIISIDDDCEMSIYYKKTPPTPQLRQITWDENDENNLRYNKEYIHNENDHNHTLQLVDNMCIDPNVNPFSVDLINAFLDQIEFTNYLEGLSTCHLLGRIPRLQKHLTFQVNEKTFEIQKLIGQGAYGAVYCGKEIESNTKYAFKQERPPNHWEYYICLQVHNRLKVEEMLPAYMSIDYALIGNNASIFASAFSEYGSLITVANQVKTRTQKLIDEYVVMHLTCELLSMFDHLHAIGIIHADVKPDNILLMNELSYPAKGVSLQLIDFGVSIDMNCFKPNQSFNYVHNDNAFKCVEMREQRPWTYQLDLYGLASVIHALLFGKYMEIEKNAVTGYWSHKTYMPRYLNKPLWETVFRTLLNIHDCNSMPNLQQLRTVIKEEIVSKEKYVIRMIHDFNLALNK